MRLSTLHVLSDDELQSIHQASLELLSGTGMVVHSRKVLELLSDHGARVDPQASRVRIPPEMVEKALSTVPPKIDLYNREKELSLTLGDGTPKAASGHNAIFVLDMETGERRSATKEDVADFARLSDALSNISVVGVQAMPQDVRPQATLLHAVEAVFNNCEKHLYFSPESAEVTTAIFDMARVVCDGEDLSSHPILTCQLSSTSPFTWEGGAVEAVIETAKAGVPCCFLPLPFSGVTSPITLAGTLTVHNAELLSGVVISQLVRPGTPVIYGSAWTTFDMQKANVLIGSPEAGLMRIAGTQLARFYHMPSHTISPDSDSHCHDEQNAWERLFTSMCALSSGIDLIVNAGMFATGLTVSFEQLVMDDEILGLLFRLLKGIEITEETIAADLIDRVGPGSNFLTEDHTLKYLRTAEHWQSSISNRCSYERWRQMGGPDVVQKAREKAREILKTHQPQTLSDEVRKGIGEIIRAFEGRFG